MKKDKNKSKNRKRKGKRKRKVNAGNTLVNDINEDGNCSEENNSEDE